MNKLKLLIVEDNQRQIESYKNTIELYNETESIKSGVEIHPYFFMEVDSGLLEIEKSIYDAAIIDLKLKQSDEDGLGNQIVRKARETLRIPMAIISGYPQDLDDDLNERENPFIKVYRKDIDYLPIFEELVAIKKGSIIFVGVLTQFEHKKCT